MGLTIDDPRPALMAELAQFGVVCDEEWIMAQPWPPTPAKEPAP